MFLFASQNNVLWRVHKRLRAGPTRVIDPMFIECILPGEAHDRHTQWSGRPCHKGPRSSAFSTLPSGRTPTRMRHRRTVSRACARSCVPWGVTATARASHSTDTRTSFLRSFAFPWRPCTRSARYTGRSRDFQPHLYDVLKSTRSVSLKQKNVCDNNIGAIILIKTEVYIIVRSTILYNNWLTTIQYELACF